MTKNLNQVTCSKCGQLRTMTAALRRARTEKFGTIAKFEETYICKQCKKKKEPEVKSEVKKEF